MQDFISIMTDPTVVITVLKEANLQQYEVKGQVGVDPLNSYRYIILEGENTETK